jgi:hypothetical protein
MINLVVGVGEVGSGVFDVLRSKVVTYARDKDPVVMAKKIDYLHIAIPYTEDFKDHVKGYMELYNPKVTIVYSTVPIGTCEEIGVVHSPVEGKHPAIGLSIQNSARWLGSSNKKLLKEANKLWSKFVPVRELPSASFTEALKLLSTTEYGVNIEFARYKKKIADDLGMDYVAMKQWNLDYNELYKRLGMNQFQKFILDAPEGPKGGHCVTPNAKLLYGQYPDEQVKVVGEL